MYACMYTQGFDLPELWELVKKSLKPVVFTSEPGA